MLHLRTTAAVLLCVGLIAPLFAGADKDKKDDKKEGGKKEATLIIKVPDEATLYIDGEEYTDQSDKVERTFRTPPLEPGKRYFYTILAKWQPNNYETYKRTRRAVVEAGKTSELDMTKVDPKQPDDIFIRYVPTPQAVVDKMMEMGKVGKDDVVFDLGCGDGRLVVTAVSKFMAKKGVGVDLDKERIKESMDNAKDAKVTDKVEFRIQDVMKVPDLEQATVVTMYLSDGLSDQLRPILQKRLKPGSRIVSHRFLMGAWKPEKTETVTVAGTPYKIHVWTVAGEVKKDGPTKDAPTKDAPTKDAPMKDAPKKDAPTKDAPMKDAPTKDAPKKDAPTKDASTKDAPMKDAPKKDAPVKDAPTKDAPMKDAPKKEVAKKDAPVKDAPMKDAPTKDAPVKDAPTKDAPTKDK